MAAQFSYDNMNNNANSENMLYLLQNNNFTQLITNYVQCCNSARKSGLQILKICTMTQNLTSQSNSKLLIITDISN